MKVVGVELQEIVTLAVNRYCGNFCIFDMGRRNSFEQIICGATGLPYTSQPMCVCVCVCVFVAVLFSDCFNQTGSVPALK